MVLRERRPAHHTRIVRWQRKVASDAMHWYNGVHRVVVGVDIASSNPWCISVRNHPSERSGDVQHAVALCARQHRPSRRQSTAIRTGPAVNGRDIVVTHTIYMLHYEHTVRPGAIAPASFPPAPDSCNGHGAVLFAGPARQLLPRSSELRRYAANVRAPPAILGAPAQCS